MSTPATTTHQPGRLVLIKHYDEVGVRCVHQDQTRYFAAKQADLDTLTAQRWAYDAGWRRVRKGVPRKALGWHCPQCVARINAQREAQGLDPLAWEARRKTYLEMWQEAEMRAVQCAKDQLEGSR